MTPPQEVEEVSPEAAIAQALNSWGGFPSEEEVSQARTKVVRVISLVNVDDGVEMPVPQGWAPRAARASQPLDMMVEALVDPPGHSDLHSVEVDKQTGAKYCVNCQAEVS